MRYMGDQPTKQSRVGNELTDEIFEPALKHVCRVMLVTFFTQLTAIALLLRC